jgi:3-deoxy-D-manno-octulosonic-acid transferase
MIGRRAYTLALRLALPLILGRLWWRGRREPGYREGIAERFGKYSAARPEKLIWIHAVSVGEARAAAPLVEALREALPDHGVLITSTTAAGRETVRQLYGQSVLSAYLPYDLPGAARRFLRYFRPRLGVLMETEIWPNLLAACAEQSLPVMLGNARMSEKSARGYARHSAVSRPAFHSLAAVAAQSEVDAQRLRELGAGRVEVVGNLKFDAQPDPAQVAAGQAWRAALARPVLTLASTRDGEEQLLIDALPPWDGRLLVVIVPRHPRRFDEVARLVQSRRTQGPNPAPADRIHLGDTMGEMGFYYGASDVAVVGGSFQPLGGQNLIEALAAGAPVVTGPSMFNFAEATQLALEAGAALQSRDAAEAIRIALDLLQDTGKRATMSRAGQALCQTHRGATQRHLEICRELLRAPARG